MAVLDLFETLEYVHVATTRYGFVVVSAVADVDKHRRRVGVHSYGKLHAEDLAKLVEHVRSLHVAKLISLAYNESQLNMVFRTA